jgi:hypothetical protein
VRVVLVVIGTTFRCSGQQEPSWQMKHKNGKERRWLCYDGMRYVNQPGTLTCLLFVFHIYIIKCPKIVVRWNR